jgi:hypothetical protein
MFTDDKNFFINDWLSVVNTLVRRWTSSPNQRWTARHYLFTRLAHPVRLTTITSIWWLDEPFLTNDSFTDQWSSHWSHHFTSLSDDI